MRAMETTPAASLDTGKGGRKITRLTRAVGDQAEPPNERGEG